MAIAQYQTNPIFVKGFLSGGQARIVQENTQYLYDTLRSFPLHGTYHATNDQVLWINFPQNAFYPVWAGGFYKTAGRDELFVNFAYQCAGAGYEHRADIYIYNANLQPTLLEQIRMAATSLTPVSRTYNISSLPADQPYFVVIFAGRTGSQRNTAGSGYPNFWHRIQIDSVVGRPAGAATVTGFPALPTFSGDNNFISTPNKLNALCAAADWLFTRATMFRRPGYSGVVQRALDTQITNDQRVHHASVPYCSGRNTLLIRGRFESVNQQRMSVEIGGTELWSQAYNNPTRTVYDPWEIPIDISGLGLANFSTFRAGIDYQRTSTVRAPRPRLSVYEIAAVGAHFSGSYQAMNPLTALNDYSVPTLQAELDKISTNLAAAKSQYDTLAFYLERDRPYSWQWDTSQRYAYHPQGDPNSVDRDERTWLAPACFVRNFDVLDVWGINMRIVWGVPTFDLEDKVPATYKPYYEYKVSEDPEAIEQRTVYLDAVKDKDFPLARGMNYWLVADRLYYAGERAVFGQA
jgi:hypothetical protein